MISEEVQRKRSKGWRMPEDAIYVGRPTKWGNPYQVQRMLANLFGVYNSDGESIGGIYHTERTAQIDAVRMYEEMMRQKLESDSSVLDELKGKKLACWCKVGEPCHRTALLRLLEEVEE